MENSSNQALYPLMEKVISDTTLTSKEKIKLIDELRKNNPVAYDRWAPRIALYILGATAIATIICIAISNGETNEGLIAIGSAAVGGIAGLVSQVQRTNKIE
ncbi:hypothetical protein NAT51_10125 [Flavobacterium amniphilum]|uniref:hypothetical protein n=1 Tax=Flavobacterium amniphilum TaxID=1834035 RepID=UPI00202A25E1|nr:hypothetical protein [Flavobacterium amniphilum]MCL9805880.1 hypothetical protein [Flavobacterium amniphilum]